MNSQEFRLLARHRILQASMEINQEIYPIFPVKSAVNCCVSFNDNGIHIWEVDYLTNHRKNNLLASLSYDSVESIQINPIQKMTAAMFVIGTRFNLDMKIHMKDGFIYQFECEEMGGVSALSAILDSWNVAFVDEFGLVAIFKDQPDAQLAYESLREHMNSLTESARQDQLRLSSMK